MNQAFIGRKKEMGEKKEQSKISTPEAEEPYFFPNLLAN
jgi:hypothetical protein